MAVMMEIGTPEDLIEFRNRVNAGEVTLGAKLTADIDMGGVNWDPIGQYAPLFPERANSTLADDYSYRGQFDGDGHCVSNFVLSSSDAVHVRVEGVMWTGMAAGFFGSLSSGAVVSSLRLEDFSIDVPERLPGWDREISVYGGGVAGVNLGGRIERVSITGGEIFIKTYAGGVVGWNGKSGIITNSMVRGTMKITASYAGGVIGCNAGIVTNCAAGGIGAISGFDVGGVAGRNNWGAAISNCAARGIKSIEGSFAGALVGSNHSSITNCTAREIKNIEGKIGAGVVGFNNDGLTNCAASDIGTISGYQVGGFIGAGMCGIVTNCLLLAGEAPTVLAGDTEGGMLGHQGSEDGKVPNIITLMENCSYPSNLVFTNGEKKPIGNINLADFAGAEPIDPYDVTVDASALPALVAIIEQGISLTLKKGDTRTLDIKTLPGTLGIDKMMFKWGTENANIVTVSQESDTVASLTGVESGMANVTCTIRGSLRAKLICAVTVIEAKPEIVL